jgi:uncharacterized protein with HEPN domain
VKRDHVRLLHIRDAILRIQNYASARADLDEPLIQDAVIRNLEVIGEAVKALSADVRQKHSAIPWADIAGMRDRLIHHYFSVDLDLVWDVVETRLHDLEAVVAELLKDQSDQA